MWQVQQDPQNENPKTTKSSASVSWFPRTPLTDVKNRRSTSVFERKLMDDCSSLKKLDQGSTPQKSGSKSQKKKKSRKSCFVAFDSIVEKRLNESTDPSNTVKHSDTSHAHNNQRILETEHPVSCSDTDIIDAEKNLLNYELPSDSTKQQNKTDQQCNLVENTSSNQEATYLQRDFSLELENSPFIRTNSNYGDISESVLSVKNLISEPSIDIQENGNLSLSKEDLSALVETYLLYSGTNTPADLSLSSPTTLRLLELDSPALQNSNNSNKNDQELINCFGLFDKEQTTQLHQSFDITFEKTVNKFDFCNQSEEKIDLNDELSDFHFSPQENIVHDVPEIFGSTKRATELRDDEDVMLVETSPLVFLDIPNTEVARSMSPENSVLPNPQINHSTPYQTKSKLQDFLFVNECIPDKESLNNTSLCVLADTASHIFSDIASMLEKSTTDFSLYDSFCENETNVEAGRNDIESQNTFENNKNKYLSGKISEDNATQDKKMQLQSVESCMNTSTIPQNDATTSMLHKSFADMDLNTSVRATSNASMVTDVQDTNKIIKMTGSTVDRSVCMETITIHNASLMAVPEIQDRQTMTEQTTYVDSSSSMTPFKSNKKGFRLTAEDVRKQHPRTVANELQTLLVANQKLEKEMKTLVQTREKQASSLKDATVKIKHLEKEVQNAGSSKLDELSALKKLHAEQDIHFKETLNRNDEEIFSLRKNLMEKETEMSKKIASLSSELEELTQKNREIETTSLSAEQQYMEDIANLRKEFDNCSYYKEFTMAEQVISELQEERLELVHLVEDLEQSLGLQEQLKDQSQALSLKSKTIFTSVLKANKKLQEQHEKLTTDLQNAQDEIVILLDEIENMSKDKESMEDAQQVLMKQLAEQENELKEVSQSGDSLMNEISDLKVLLDEATYQLDLERQGNTTLQSTLKEEKENLTALSSKHEQIVENLLHTVDSLEQDVAIRDKELHELRCELKSEKQDLQEANEELVELDSLRSQYTTKLDKIAEQKSVIEFIESENKALNQLLHETDEKYKRLQQSILTRDDFIEELERANSILTEEQSRLTEESINQRQKITELEENMKVTERSVDSLESNVKDLLHVLESNIEELKNDPFFESHERSVRKRTFAVNRVQRARQENNPMLSGSKTRRCLESQLNSEKLSVPFSPAQMLQTSLDDGRSLCAASPGFAQIRPIQSTWLSLLDSASRTKSKMVENKVSSRAGITSLPDKITAVNQLLDEVYKVTTVCQKACQHAVRSRSDEVVYVSEALKREKAERDRLEAKANKFPEEVIDIQRENKQLITIVNDLKDKILSYNNKEIRVLELENEVKSLKRELTTMKENKVQDEYLDTTVRTSKDSSELIKSLMTENNALREKKMILDQKAIERMKLYKTNLKRAEAEANRLDELVETLRQECQANSRRNPHPVLEKLMCIIDGLDNPSSRN